MQGGWIWHGPSCVTSCHQDQYQWWEAHHSAHHHLCDTGPLASSAASPKVPNMEQSPSGCLSGTRMEQSTQIWNRAPMWLQSDQYGTEHPCGCSQTDLRNTGSTHVAVPSASAVGRSVDT